MAKLNKDGTPDKRFKANKKIIKKVEPVKESGELQSIPVVKLNPNELLDKLLKDNNLKLDFDVLEGTITTKYGIIKLAEKQLVLKASYVQSK